METMESTRELEQLIRDAEPAPSEAVLPSRFCILRFQDEHLAVALSQVREICKLGSITSVPGMPRWLVGVANLHGNIIPIVDVCPLLGLPGTAALHYAVVVRQGVQHIGIVVENVPQIQSAEVTDPGQTPPSEGIRACPFLSGSVITAGQTIRVMDVSMLLATIEGRSDRQAA